GPDPGQKPERKGQCFFLFLSGKQIGFLNQICYNNSLWKKQGKGGGNCGKERKVFIKDRIYPDLSRMCHWTGKCLAVSVYYGTVWRGGVCAGLSVLPVDSGTADPGHGVLCRTGQPEKHCPFFSGAGAERQ